MVFNNVVCAYINTNILHIVVKNVKKNYINKTFYQENKFDCIKPMVVTFLSSSC